MKLIRVQPVPRVKELLDDELSSVSELLRHLSAICRVRPATDDFTHAEIVTESPGDTGTSGVAEPSQS